MSLDDDGHGTPLDHYREAESLLSDALELGGAQMVSVEDLTRRAIAHALLAGCHMTAGVWGDEGRQAGP